MRTRTVEIEAAAATTTVALTRIAQIKFDSPEGESLRDAMAAQWEEPTAAEAATLVPWVEALLRDLRAIAE